MSSILELNLTSYCGFKDRTALLATQHLHCQPTWGTYEVTLAYNNGLRTVSYRFINAQTLRSTFTRGIWPLSSFGEDRNAKWSPELVNNLRVLNYYGILDAIASTLAGSYSQVPVKTNAPKFPHTLENSTTLELAPLGTAFMYFGGKRAGMAEAIAGADITYTIRKFES